MHYITTSFWKMFFLVWPSIIVTGIALQKIFKALFHVEYWCGGLIESFVKLWIAIFLGAFLATGVNNTYAFFHPHDLCFTDVIEYFDPYIGYHEWPSDDSYCTPEGDRITREECLQLFHETHDLAYDSEGNVIATYPKGAAPPSDRAEDSPYYKFNMSEEQLDAYQSAKYIIGNANYISKAKVFDRLTDPYNSYQYSSEAAAFALEALEENGLVDWAEFCKQEAEVTYDLASYLSRDDMFRYLTEDEEYTEEEAWYAVEAVYGGE